jgi:hypothetical protein
MAGRSNWLARPLVHRWDLAAHDLRWRGDWRPSICRTGTEIEGISVVMPGRHWVSDQPKGRELIGECRQHPRSPTKLAAPAPDRA